MRSALTWWSHVKNECRSKGACGSRLGQTLFSTAGMVSPEVVDVFLGGDSGDGVVLLLPGALHAETAKFRQLSAQTI